jgi:hypothetical protein|nr:MAG TPA: hypothetical protein [Caudoviricetes sp.]
MKMLSELENSLDKEHIVVKNVLCSFSKRKTKSSRNRLLNINIKQLEEIYQGDFRHQYSKLFLIISAIDKHQTLDTADLLQSMNETAEYVKNNHSKYNGDFRKCFDKLYDHVTLEILQINYMRGIENKGDANNATTMKELKSAMSLAKTASDNADKATDKLNGMQKDYITILGIFAAIILAFVSGLVFSNSVLQNIDKASIYKLLLISIIIGFFITNILLFLFNFVKSIVRNNENNSALDPHISYFNLAAIILILVLFAVSVSHESIYKKYDSNSTINVNTANISFSSNR